MRRILIGVIILGVLLLVGFVLVSSSCGGSAEEGEGLPDPPPEPTLASSAPSPASGPGVQATVAAQVEQTIEAQTGAQATAVAEAVATLTRLTPEPSPTAQASVESRVPVFRRTPEPALLATVAPTPTIVPTLTAGPWPTVPLPEAVEDPDAESPLGETDEPGLPSGELVWYRHEDNSFLTYHPEDWNIIVAEESSVRFWLGDRSAQLAVEVFQVPPGTELQDFLEQRVLAGAIEARGWMEYTSDVEFDLVAFGSWPAYLADYQRRVDLVTCGERVRSALFLSRIPLADIGFQVTLMTCGSVWETYAVYWNDIIRHFQEGSR